MTAAQQASATSVVRIVLHCLNKDKLQPSPACRLAADALRSLWVLRRAAHVTDVDEVFCAHAQAGHPRSVRLVALEIMVHLVFRGVIPCERVLDIALGDVDVYIAYKALRLLLAARPPKRGYSRDALARMWAFMTRPVVDVCLREYCAQLYAKAERHKRDIPLGALESAAKRQAVVVSNGTALT